MENEETASEKWRATALDLETEVQKLRIENQKLRDSLFSKNTAMFELAFEMIFRGKWPFIRRKKIGEEIRAISGMEFGKLRK